MSGNVLPQATGGADGALRGAVGEHPFLLVYARCDAMQGGGSFGAECSTMKCNIRKRAMASVETLRCGGLMIFQESRPIID